MTFPHQPGDHLYSMRRLPSEMWNTPSRFKCADCHDTGTVTVTLYGVPDGDRYEQASERCHCKKESSNEQV